MENKKNIIYVNYSPYENAGKILDFLIENFDLVFLFSIGFYNLKNKNRYNDLIVYNKGHLINHYLLFQIPIPIKLTFLLLPLQSFLIFIQIFVYSFWLKSKYGKIETFFSVNAFTSWIGLMLKRVGIVKKTVFWVWDYYPPTHKNKVIAIIRSIYWQFDRISSHSDRVVFLSKKLIDLRKNIGVIPQNSNFQIVPIGTDNLLIKPGKKTNPIVFAFIGVLKKSQGLEVIFDNAAVITKRFPKAIYEIIGSGPDEEYFKEKAINSKIKSKFYGYLDEKTLNEVLRKCTIGIATYVKDKGNVSHYSDPGKVKLYLSLGLPIIATDVFEFAHEIEKAKAGVIINTDNPKEVLEGTKRIMSDYDKYSANALELSRKFFYKKIYPKIFSDEQNLN